MLTTRVAPFAIDLAMQVMMLGLGTASADDDDGDGEDALIEVHGGLAEVAEEDSLLEPCVGGAGAAGSHHGTVRDHGSRTRHSPRRTSSHAFQAQSRKQHRSSGRCFLSPQGMLVDEPSALLPFDASLPSSSRGASSSRFFASATTQQQHPTSSASLFTTSTKYHPSAYGTSSPPPRVNSHGADLDADINHPNHLNHPNHHHPLDRVPSSATAGWDPSANFATATTALPAVPPIKTAQPLDLSAPPLAALPARRVPPPGAEPMQLQWQPGGGALPLPHVATTPSSGSTLGVLGLSPRGRAAAAAAAAAAAPGGGFLWPHPGGGGGAGGAFVAGGRPRHSIDLPVSAGGGAGAPLGRALRLQSGPGGGGGGGALKVLRLEGTREEAAAALLEDFPGVPSSLAAPLRSLPPWGTPSPGPDEDMADASASAAALGPWPGSGMARVASAPAPQQQAPQQQLPGGFPQAGGAPAVFVTAPQAARRRTSGGGNSGKVRRTAAVLTGGRKGTHRT